MEIKSLSKAKTDFFQKRQTLWNYIRKAEYFTVKDLMQLVNVTGDYVLDFLKPYRKAGIVVEKSINVVTFEQKIFAVVGKHSAIIPRFTKSGKPLIEKRELMWRTMKMLSSFNFVDLALQASTDTDKVKPKDAEDYVKNLHRAGYLVLLEKPTYKSKAVYKLKPSMNTGAYPPQVKRTRAVYDPNTGQVYLADILTSED